MIQTIVLHLIFNYVSVTHDMLSFVWSINVFVPFDCSPEEGRARQIVQNRYQNLVDLVVLMRAYIVLNLL